jgi:hypothetical protein
MLPAAYKHQSLMEKSDFKNVLAYKVYVVDSRAP